MNLIAQCDKLNHFYFSQYMNAASRSEFFRFNLLCEIFSQAGYYALLLERIK